MTAGDRELLRRDCLDALKALQEDRDVVARVTPLTVIWHLIRAIEELEKGT